MGHHHGHHGGHHFFKLGRGRRGPPAPAWVSALGLAAFLFAGGAIDGIATYRPYFHGEHAMGVVTRVSGGRTSVQINGHTCTLRGERGHPGQMLPVAYLANQQEHCVVRQLSSFHWAGTSIFVSLVIAAGVLLYRRSSISAAIDPPTQ